VTGRVRRQLFETAVGRPLLPISNKSIQALLANGTRVPILVRQGSPLSPDEREACSKIEHHWDHTAVGLLRSVYLDAAKLGRDLARAAREQAGADNPPEYGGCCSFRRGSARNYSVPDLFWC
jgi:hypothetical protein